MMYVVGATKAIHLENVRKLIPRLLPSYSRGR